MLKKYLPILIIICLVLIFSAIYIKHKVDQRAFIEKGRLLAANVKYPPNYLIVLLGDSMTEALGNSDELRVYMDSFYPGKTFDFLNYGFGSTNILSVPERLTQHTFHTRDFKPILDIDFNLIIIESFGYNPLSQYPLNEGLAKQNETLDKIVSLIKEKRPNSKIIFLATISPNKNKFGQGSVDLSSDKRKQWVEDRVAYINNHIQYAKSHNIPLINVFDKSKDRYGNGNLKYIETKTFIHPSPVGIILISKEIADFIYNNKLLN